MGMTLTNLVGVAACYRDVQKFFYQALCNCNKLVDNLLGFTKDLIPVALVVVECGDHEIESCAPKQSDCAFRAATVTRY